jgi:ABC-2 type transport system ATP-binding protein
VNQEAVRETILDLAARGTTIVLSTHLMDEVERLCTHLTLIDSGRALVDGTLDEVKRRHGTDTLRIDVQDDPALVEALPEVAECRRIGRTLEIRLRDGADPSEFLSRAASLARIRRFEVRAPSLHSIFVQLVGGKAGVDASRTGAAETLPSAVGGAR